VLDRGLQPVKNSEGERDRREVARGWKCIGQEARKIKIKLTEQWGKRTAEYCKGQQNI
jgi:hypothetical protein